MSDTKIIKALLELYEAETSQGSNKFTRSQISKAILALEVGDVAHALNILKELEENQGGGASGFAVSRIIRAIMILCGEAVSP